VAFGGEDYGIDGYHFDKAKRNLYLFQFKWSNDHEQFKPGFRTLLEHGMSEVFGANAVGEEPQRDGEQVEATSCVRTTTRSIRSTSISCSPVNRRRRRTAVC
jgi:hypothetical protein